MSTPILPFAVWESGTNQNSVPANDNSLRNQILNGLVISDSTNAEPALVSPADDGAIYIMTGAATGTHWSTFDEFDLAIFVGGTWYAFAPVEGVVVNLAGAMVAWDGAAYTTVGGGGSFTGGSLSSALNEAKGSNIASATTTDIGAATGNLVHVTGTTTITGLGTVQAGTERVVVFDAILTLTHNGTSLILPTGANITTAAGDAAIFRSEGAGNWRCVVYQRASGAALSGGGGGGLTNWTEAVNSSSPNATIPVVSFVATNAATNVDAVLKAKGNGALSAQVADSTTTGGNKRGRRAVDWQASRTNAANVASGDDSTIGGGTDNIANNPAATVAGGNTNSATNSNATVGGGANNVASGANSVVAGGSANTATNTNAAVLGGSGNAATGAHSAILGGQNGTAGADFATVLGGRSATARSCKGAAARSALTFLVAASDTQTRDYWMLADTTDATPEPMATDNATAAASNTVVLPNSSVYLVRGDVCAREQTTGDVKTWEFRATIKRGANAAATAIVGTAVVTVCDADAGAAAWALAITANTTLGGLAIGITGQAAKNIKWAAAVRSLENVTA